MTLVVSDTSPIRALDFLGQLPLLEKLFGKVLIPPAVRDELTSPLPKFTPVHLPRFSFIEVREPRDTHQVQLHVHTLVVGEFEAIAIAVDEYAKIISMDELMGRELSKQSGLVRRAWERGLLNI